MKNKNKYLLVIGIMLFAFIVIGVTYAIYRPKVTKINDTETVIKTNELGLVYTGPESLSCSNMIPGDKCIKHFTVENTSNAVVTYNIYMEQITNEFNEDLVYTLADETGTVVGETALPITNTNKEYIKKDISIGAKAIKNYTLTIEFKYTNQPQNDMQGAEFKATIGIDTVQNSGNGNNDNKIICKPATTLDEENGIKYGTIFDEDELKAGNAFDCDVDGTGYNKRFYYLRNIDTNTVALIYSNNTNGKTLDSSAAVEYNSTSNDDGPISAMTYLPTKSDWSNINITDITVDLKSTNNEVIKQNYKYEGYAARLLSFDDIKDACDVTIGSNKEYELAHCNFLFQNVTDSEGNYWTDTAWHSYIGTNGPVMMINYEKKNAISAGVRYQGGVRPVIYVNIKNIDKVPEPDDYSKILNNSNVSCKRATELHANGDLYYGSLGTKGTLTSGDAFDCDVDGTGYNHRFYYVSPLYTGGAKGKETWNDDIAVLIYYNNVVDGVDNNQVRTGIEYNKENKNNLGPTNLLGQLPTADINGWKNLKNTARTIKNQLGSKTTLAGSLPGSKGISKFSYENYAARLLTTQEIEKACDITITISSSIPSKCLYLLENIGTGFDYVRGYWLETPHYYNSNSVFVVLNSEVSNYGVGYTGDFGVRPAIDVPVSRIDY